MLLAGFAPILGISQPWLDARPPCFNAGLRTNYSHESKRTRKLLRLLCDDRV